MNWDYIFPIVLVILMILWGINWGMQGLCKRFFDIAERAIDVIEQKECHDITEWQQKLQKMHRRAQKAESDLAKLAKGKGFTVTSFHYAIFMVGLADDLIAIQEGENPLIMEKVDGVVVIRNQTNNLVCGYIHPDWLNANWKVGHVHNQA